MVRSSFSSHHSDSPGTLTSAAAHASPSAPPPKRCVFHRIESLCKASFSNLLTVLMRAQGKKTLEPENFFHLFGLLPSPGVDGLASFQFSDFSLTHRRKK